MISETELFDFDPQPRKVLDKTLKADEGSIGINGSYHRDLPIIENEGKRSLAEFLNKIAGLLPDSVNLTDLFNPHTENVIVTPWKDIIAGLEDSDRVYVGMNISEVTNSMKDTIGKIRAAGPEELESLVGRNKILENLGVRVLDERALFIATVFNPPVELCPAMQNLLDELSR